MPPKIQGALRTCYHCGKSYPVAGGSATRHENRCLQDQAAKAASAQARENLNRAFRELEASELERRNTTGIPGPIEKGSLATFADYEVPDGFMDQDGDYLMNCSSSDNGSSEANNEPPYIRITPHPRSKQPVRILGAEQPLSEQVEATARKFPPYSPFPTWNDFTFADSRVRRPATSNFEINEDLTMMRNGLWAEKCKLTFENADEMWKMVDSAAEVYQQFRSIDYTIPLKKKNGEVVELQYTVWVKDASEWIKELVKDPSLSRHWKWYAEKKEIVTNGVAERFIDDPLSADDAWKEESHLEGDQVQILLILYSDKSNAARFSKTMDIWPALARIANLPSNISNQTSEYAGNTLLGFLPHIKPPPGEEENDNWANHGREALHRAWDYILQPVARDSKSGFSIKCGDNVIRQPVIRVPIIANDLEEAYKTALTRGTKANIPCPRCLVPHEEQSNLCTRWDLRIQKTSKEIYTEAQLLKERGRASAAEQLLKENGLCDVKNAWWSISRADVYQALSFDVLHSIFLGLWGKHIWPEVLGVLGDNGKRILDERAKQVPGFPGLKRFSSTTMCETTFSDGNTFFSILQQILPLIHDLISQEDLPLLRLVRLLADITIHARFKMQTISRLGDGDALITAFAEVLDMTRKVLPSKVWDFPKMHQLAHLFDDIRNKGCTSYLSCTIGESSHQGFIAAYAASNKKDATRQITRSESRKIAMSRIGHRVKEEKERLEREKRDAEEDKRTQQQDGLTHIQGNDDRNAIEPSERIPMLAPTSNRRTDAKAIEDRLGYFDHYIGDPIFKDFGTLLSRFIRHSCATLKKVPEDSLPLHLPFKIGIKVYRRIDLTYFSLDNGLEQKDLIQCRPSFHHQPRFDTVLVQTPDGSRPARLRLLFNVVEDDLILQVAYVTFFTRIRASRIDKVIAMNRYQEEPQGEFIFLQSIIRACYLTPIYSSPGYFYLNNLVTGCTDLYLRCALIAN